MLDVINEAYRKMLERKARLGQMVVTDDGTGQGTWKTQPALDVYLRVYGPLPPLPNAPVPDAPR